MVHEQDLYKKYLNSFNFTKETILFSDIGYAGTIPKVLTGILKRNTQAFLAIASDPGVHNIGDHNCHIESCLCPGAKFGGNLELLNKSLLFESILTAPHGPFIQIESDKNNNIIFKNGETVFLQRNPKVLENLHKVS